MGNKFLRKGLNKKPGRLLVEDMKALSFNQTGDALQVLTTGEFDKPVAQTGEVVVRVSETTLNPADFLFIQGKYRTQPVFPQIAGMEGTGRVESVGAGVTIPTGTLVAFFWRKAWAEYVVVPETELVVLPVDFPVEKAAQMGLNPQTAWGLLERVNVQPGEWLLLTAGNSVVAQLLIQLAVLRGIKVISVVRSNKSNTLLKELGAEIIDLSVSTVEQRVMEITGGKGLQGALDAVGGPTMTEVFKCMARNGRVILYGSLSPEPFSATNPIFHFKNVSLSGFGVRGYLGDKTVEQRTSINRQLAELIGKPTFRLGVTATYSLTEWKEAVQRMRMGESGKVLLRFSGQ
jgi:NADPH:quinone reductase-like Zn-dependent oxidoreductase